MLRRLKSCVTTFLAFLSVCGHGNSLNSSLDFGASSSQSYEARNVFVHPAALGYDTALNGADLSTSFALGANSGRESDLAFGLALGYFGFGIERMADFSFSRYRIALGLPLSSRMFFGARLSLYRYDAGNSLDAWDFGLQYRVTSYLALSLLTEHVNQPVSGSVRLPLLTTAAITVRPVAWGDVTLDVSTPADAFLRTLDYQAVVGIRLAQGLKVRFGYHSDYQWMAGLQMHFGNASLYSTIQPSSNSRKFVLGTQSSTKPYPSAIAPNRTAKITLGPNLSDEKVAGSLFTSARPSLLDLLKDLETLEKDDSFRTVLIRIEDFPLGLASAHEAHLALKRLRKNGKHVEVYLGNAGIKEYLIAAAGDRIYLEPAGELRWVGLKSERYFLKGTLDKIGVEGEFLATGKYKSAPEMFLRKESSEAARAAALDEMQSLEGTLLELLESSRKIDEKKWKRLLELGLLSAEEALSEKLIDGTASFSTVITERERGEWISPVPQYRRDSLALPPRITVVVASGNILPNRIRWLALGGTDQVTPVNIERKLRQANADGRTEALVFRVSSPGGEVLASQQIASQIETAAKEKPLYVSMGDVAASGGYYVSAPARRVFAGPLTMTGSIGVFLGKFSLSGLYKWMDLHKEVLTRSPYPGLYSEDRPWTKSEKAVMERRLLHYYDNFLEFVARGRKLPVRTVKEAAGGRVWTGKHALDHKLVDEIGGYREVIRRAAADAGLSEGAYEVFEVEASSDLFDLWRSDTWAEAFSRPAQSEWFKLLPPEATQGLLWFSTLRDSPFLYVSPMTPPDA